MTGVRGRVVAVLVAFFYFAVVAVSLAVSAGGEKHRRELGRGQVRFDGAGPERWALRYRRERRAAVRLRGLLAARLDRVIWMVNAFQCIHSYEGSWSANTGNGYYGGLQMDIVFQRDYGRELLTAKGTANHWTPAEQISVAIRAHATRGFGPWPKTARRCGLR